MKIFRRQTFSVMKMRQFVHFFHAEPELVMYAFGAPRPKPHSIAGSLPDMALLASPLEFLMDIEVIEGKALASMRTGKSLHGGESQTVVVRFHLNTNRVRFHSEARKTDYGRHKHRRCD